MNNMEKHEIGLVFGIIMLLSFTIGFAMGTNNGKEISKLEAVRENKAHYQIDKDGRAVFEWNKDK